jgi:cell pole-organizing protein PopZ
MSDPTAQEPTMEEILASIRRIISEDDAPAAEPPAAERAEPAAHPEPAPAAPTRPTLVEAAPLHEEVADEEDEVLELTDPAPKPAETHGDIDVFAPAAAEPSPAPLSPAVKPEPAPLAAAAPAVLHEDEPLLSGGSLDRAASHFGRLSQSVAMPASGQTLEAVVRDLLRPLLKDWLDEHLPAIVEERVQAEVERVSRRRV